ncbi:MAG: hypothetical protein M1504_00015 [Candidatus Marsarchaeota archaeon]|nr:hypothetical protein [Candidatus Marsarchaeota archaeon]
MNSLFQTGSRTNGNGEVVRTYADGSGGVYEGRPVSVQTDIAVTFRESIQDEASASLAGFVPQLRGGFYTRARAVRQNWEKSSSEERRAANTLEFCADHNPTTFASMVSGGIAIPLGDVLVSLSGVLDEKSFNMVKGRLDAYAKERIKEAASAFEKEVQKFNDTSISVVALNNDSTLHNTLCAIQSRCSKLEDALKKFVDAPETLTAQSLEACINEAEAGVLKR